MKILLHYHQWGNRWIPYFEKELSRYDLTVTSTEDGEELGKLSEKADVLLSMWCDGITAFWTRFFGDKKIITYLRRYEMWEQLYMENVDFPLVDAIIFVSDYYKRVFNKMVVNKPKYQFVIPNSVDIDKFPFRKEHIKNKDIALVCSIKNVNNIPLAFQILMELPKEYKLHQIGLSQHNSQIVGQIYSYMHNLGLADRFITHSRLPIDEVPNWLMNKDCLLSTSLNEGNPNNIIEAMAMGVKPIIHNWPGARDQFPDDLVFDKIREAVQAIEEDKYEPERYRQIVREKYSLDNFKKLHEVIETVNG
jgi:glycosyltransferase involved in cell wall biosynthesis